jgi:hypothetical protein
VSSPQKLPIVNFRPVAGIGDPRDWEKLAIACGFDELLALDDLNLLGASVAETLSQFPDEDLCATVDSFSERQKTELRQRASKRACSRAYVIKATA